MKLRIRFWVEAGITALTGSLFVLTIMSRDWIERLFGVDPDHHTGIVEWLLFAVLLLATLVSGALSRAEWRHRSLGR